MTTPPWCREKVMVYCYYYLDPILSLVEKGLGSTIGEFVRTCVCGVHRVERMVERFRLLEGMMVASTI